MKIRNRICPRQYSPWEEILLNPLKGINGVSLVSVFNDKSLQARKSSLEGKNINRSVLASFLESQQSGLTLTELQRTYLAESKEPDSLFIITGQQPGALGGPILWLYKALTAVSVAKQLRNRLQVPVIPVFWIAGDDDDVEECGFIQAARLDGRQLVMRLFPAGSGPAKCLSLLKLGKGVEPACKKLRGFWQPKTMSLVEKFLNPEFTFTESFRHLAQEVLGAEGILFLDGFSHEFRRLSSDYLRRFIEDWKVFESHLTRVNRLLEKQDLKPQADYRHGTVHAFSLDRGERDRIMAEGERFVTGKRRPFRLESELPAGAGAASITHDAITRALLIEAVMPVVGHVLGPHEMGYFMQIGSLFNYYFESPPLVFPRMKASLITRTQQNAFAEAGVRLEKLPSLKPSELRNLFLKDIREKVLPEKIRRLTPDGWLKLLEQSQNQFKNDMPNRQPSFTRFTTKIHRVWEKYLDDLSNAFYSKLAPERAHLDRAMAWLGKGAGQDTQLNFFSVVDILGVDNLQSFLKALKPLSTGHQLLTLE